MITTECMICDIVEDKPSGGGGDMGGMGGMGGMM
jgi:chaperonin GroEL